MSEQNIIKKTLIFFALATFFSMLFCKASINLNLDHRVNVLFYSFGVPAALLIMRGTEINKAMEFEDFKRRFKWLLIAFIVPFVYTFVFYLLGKFIFPYTPDPLNQNSVILYSIVLIFMSVTFEEIGWRGYLYKYLTAEGWFKMNLFISILWTLWHLPAIIYGGFTIPSPFALGIVLFFVNLTLASFMLGWIRQKTGGVLSPILVHAGHNIAMVLTSLSGPLLGETGIFFTAFLITSVILTRAWKSPKFFEFEVIKEKVLG